ncbi:MAG: hypothetical protein WCG32_04645 [Actinomycetes bacterium]
MNTQQALSVLKQALDSAISSGAIKSIQDAQTIAIAFNVIANEIKDKPSGELQ